MGAALHTRAFRRLGLAVGLGGLAAAVPGAAGARELILGIQSSVNYDSNIFAQEDGEDDYFLRIGPTLELRDQTGDLTYSLRYVPAYEWYLDFTELDDWEQFFFGEVGIRLGPNTRLSLRDTFYDAASARRATEVLATSAPTDPTTPTSVLGSDRYLSNYASATISHNVSRRFVVEGVLSYNLDRSDLDTRSDTDVYTAQGSLIYALNPTNRLGGGYAATLQHIGETDFRLDSDTWYHNVFGIYQHDFSPTWRFQLQAGPTLVDAEEQIVPEVGVVNRYPLFISNNRTFLLDYRNCAREGNVVTDTNCTIIGPVENTSPELAQNLRASFLSFNIQDRQEPSGGSDLTYFADVSLTKEWETVDVTISYRRSAGTSSGIGTNTIDDTVRGTVTWRPTRKWRITAFGLWDQQKSVGEAQRNEILLTDFATALTTLPVTNVDVQLFAASAFQAELANAARAVGVRAESVSTLLDIRRYIFSLYAERQIWRGFSAFGRGTYTHQENEQRALATSEASYDAVRFELGIRYEFEPIQF